MEYKRGQILLITLLVLSVALTVVLSLISRSTTDVSLSNQVAESSKALNAAEAGIEQSLLGSTGTIAAAVGTAQYSATKTDVGAGSSVYVFPKKTSVDSIETIWLLPHVNGVLDETSSFASPTHLDVCWSDEEIDSAMFVSVWYKTSTGVYAVSRNGYEPDGPRHLTNNFSSITSFSGGCGDGKTAFKKSIDIVNDFGIPAGSKLLFLRLQPMYSDAIIAVQPTGGDQLPSQVNQIVSTGSVSSGVTRKVVVFQQYKTPAPIFDNVVYSQGTFSQ